VFWHPKSRPSLGSASATPLLCTFTRAVAPSALSASPPKAYLRRCPAGTMQTSANLCLSHTKRFRYRHEVARPCLRICGGAIDSGVSVRLLQLFKASLAISMHALVLISGCRRSVPTQKALAARATAFQAATHRVPRHSKTLGYSIWDYHYSM
jgi:hypothetical protein